MKKETLRRTVYIVGCGAAKLTRPARARDLYTGSLFRSARAFVEKRNAHWAILSARYGLVPPELVIKPYEQRLWRRQEDLKAWALTAAAGLCYAHRGVPIRVVFLCGAEYANPVAGFLEAWGIPTEQPLQGLGLGARRHWLLNEPAPQLELFGAQPAVKRARKRSEKPETEDACSARTVRNELSRTYGTRRAAE